MPPYFPPPTRMCSSPLFQAHKPVSCSTTTPSRTGFSNEPTGVAINRNNNHIFFSDDDANKIHEVSLGPDGIYCTADDAVTTVNVGSVYNIQDAGGHGLREQHRLHCWRR